MCWEAPSECVCGVRRSVGRSAQATAAPLPPSSVQATCRAPGCEAFGRSTGVCYRASAGRSFLCLTRRGILLFAFGQGDREFPHSLASALLFIPPPLYTSATLPSSRTPGPLTDTRSRTGLQRDRCTGPPVKCYERPAHRYPSLSLSTPDSLAPWTSCLLTHAVRRHLDGTADVLLCGTHF